MKIQESRGSYGGYSPDAFPDSGTVASHGLGLVVGLEGLKSSFLLIRRTDASIDRHRFNSELLYFPASLIMNCLYNGHGREDSQETTVHPLFGTVSTQVDQIFYPSTILWQPDESIV